MKPRKLVLWFAILVLSMLTITVQSAQTENRRFPLPDHGFLKLSMPVGWKHQLRQPPERLPFLSHRSGRHAQTSSHRPPRKCANR